MGESLNVLGSLISWTCIASALIGLVVYFRLNQENKYFAIYIVSGAVVEFMSNFIADQGKNNLIFFHINTLIEFSILTLFFAHIFISKKGILLNWVFAPGLLLIIINSLFVQKIDTYNSIALTAVSIYLITLCLYYFYKIIDQEVTSKQSIFTKYAVCSVFVLHGISMIVLFFGNYLNEVDHENNIYIWWIRALIILLVKITVLYQLSLLAISFYYKKAVL